MKKKEKHQRPENVSFFLSNFWWITNWREDVKMLFSSSRLLKDEILSAAAELQVNVVLAAVWWLSVSAAAHRFMFLERRVEQWQTGVCRSTYFTPDPGSVFQSNILSRLSRGRRLRVTVFTSRRTRCGSEATDVSNTLHIIKAFKTNLWLEIV